ncbi:hypothetical protein GCM10009759_14810 [Kitasatospora saccharophila]|uniref:Uncharacterized protein n=1 Tax=Kitasatospora saccharophila TaxID=407973 RepID=A0ABN2WEY0_9ACTN
MSTSREWGTTGSGPSPPGSGPGTAVVRRAVDAPADDGSEKDDGPEKADGRREEPGPGGESPGPGRPGCYGRPPRSSGIRSPASTADGRRFPAGGSGQVARSV